nr:esterase-like activity of phytase family protein [Caulobacter hibisci]
MRGLIVLGLAGGALAQCGPKAPPPPVVLPAAPVKVGPEIGLSTTPVPLNASDPSQTAVGRFVYAGGIQITSADTSRLHGLSDLILTEDGGIEAISDDGDRFSARLQLDAAGKLIGLTDGKLSPLIGHDGEGLRGKSQGDAEGLARLANGERLVSFERDHRIWRYAVSPTGLWSRPAVAPKPATVFPDNEGMEALTAYPAAGSDAYLVGGEEGEVWLCRLTTSCQPIPPQSPVDFTWGLTGFSAFGGKALATLHRAFDPVRGWRAQVKFIADPMIPATKQYPLASLTLDGQLTRDNFEGLALAAGPNGATRIYLLSDDNGGEMNQRTLLLAFDWTAPPPQPVAPPPPARKKRR